MITKTSFPRSVREIENTWIPLRDGTRLAARIWLPDDAEAHPVPAILEYLPYRKDDSTAPRDALTHPYFAGHGYASVRVDMRGSGDSDGLLLDEYLPQEQFDALEVIAWLAAQPWCTGAVGMIGISWGGFNGLQVAAHRPPALKAVITLCSTDDRYSDDCHYMGGCVLGSDMLPWASAMLAYNGLPPDPRQVGERWRQMWLDRLEHTPPFSEIWLGHQRRDAYWKQGSVCEDYSAITCPVYAVGGWADPYTNAIPRLLASLQSPRKGLIGPWAHVYPHAGAPGPAIGFLQECLRWWDCWLGGIDTGIMAEPMLRAWMLGSIPPSSNVAEWPGRWVAEAQWPPEGIESQSYLLGDRHLDGPCPAAQSEAPRVARGTPALTFVGTQEAGIGSGFWCAHGSPGDLPGDQRAEDGLSLAFTSAPVSERTEILGFPEVRLRVSVDQPRALLAARLCDISPDGASTLVTWGLLNLTHRESHETPSPLVPGQVYDVSLRLNAVAYALPAGHCWRLAISPTYWPHAWPSPQNVRLTVNLGEASRLELPVRPPKALDQTLSPFLPPEAAAPLALDRLRTGSVERSFRHDVANGRYELVQSSDGGCCRQPDGLEYEGRSTTTYSIAEGDPLSARVCCQHATEISRGAGWRIRVETSSSMWADAVNFYVTNRLEAYEGESRVFERTWECPVPRDLV